MGSLERVRGDVLLTLGDIWRLLLETIWICDMLLFLNPSDTFAAGGPAQGFLYGLAHLILDFLSLFL